MVETEFGKEVTASTPSSNRCPDGRLFRGNIVNDAVSEAVKFVGSAVPHKNVAMALPAAAVITARHPAWQPTRRCMETVRPRPTNISHLALMKLTRC
jgi:hypothetical protein